MTIDGGKPHAVGDRGQRFAVSYVDENGIRKPFGWTSTWAGAEAMARAINLHPSMEAPEIIDRHSRKEGML